MKNIFIKILVIFVIISGLIKAREDDSTNLSIESLINVEIETFGYKTLSEILYITPLRGYNIDEITQMCRETQILSFTGVSRFISDNDISVGFYLQNNKLQITINLESAKAEGANFSSRLLNISQII